ncbi:mitochondrial folate transporter/carrier [Bactrocera neohumeralis]|uniref:mitochondrial folate transporter/carrier n=1 Tax=Bactrocera tryoni TaxID=59916 RepID=UPI001A9657FC|nr:mitochondrial folate transporter/carrier [Bactrocera tryoni]XP_050327174.1 mitochondrial folate transporter/carrier [Bactrocera neohumeralis]
MAAMNTKSTKFGGKLNLSSHVKYEHLVAGISGGVTSTLILHPLDLIKIRFAVNDGRTTTVPQYSSLSSAFSTIFRQEGFRGLYKGVTPNIWGSGSSWGLYFMFYNTIKTFIQGGNTTQPLGPTLHMLAAAESGVLTLILTNPIWVVKTRLCLQYGAEASSKHTEYRGMVDALAQIYRKEGVRGLYRGFVPGILGVSHGALQFMTYEEMKNYYNTYRKLPIDTKLATSEYLAFAAISKLIAAAATYPYQVIRARMQDHHLNYTSSWDCIKQTWRYEGAVGFYKGIQASLTRVLPATMITFVIYENVSHYLLQRSKTKT